LVSFFLIGELKEQLIKDLNWKRPTESAVEAIEIGPITFKEESKKGNDSKRKQAIYLIDNEATNQQFWLFFYLLILETAEKGDQT